MINNDSTFYRQLIRHLYYYRNQSSNILKSRTYAVGKTLKTVVKNPATYAKKTIVLAVSNPRRLYDLALGKRGIQQHEAFKKQLRDDYQIWIKGNSLNDNDLKKQSSASKKFKQQPLISLITPVWNPPEDAHIKLIESVLNQTYSSFELLLFNFGDKPEIKKLLNDYAKQDDRIKVKHGLPNEGIGKNSNYCLDYIKGDFLGLLDHDDSLEPNALFECIKALNKTDTDFIYTDKDKITEEDVRFEPLCKPDWSPEMALGGNYMTHFNLMRTKLVKDLGGWDHTTDGAQDWDLFLRLINKSTKPVVHVPKIVYHWRTVKTSTAGGIGVKPYVINAQQKTVNKQLATLGVSARAQHDKHGQLNIHWNKTNNVSFLGHGIYHDLGTIIDLFEEIEESRKNDQKFEYMLFLPDVDRMEEAEHRRIDKSKLNMKIIYYKTNSFVDAVTVAKFKYDNIVYCTDSIKSATNVVGDDSWIDQLVGWLEVPGVMIASGGSYASNGQITDIGSFFDPKSMNFSKFYFGAGEMSCRNGYKQWTRNHVLVSEKLYAFDTSILNNLKDFKLAEDHEFTKLLALITYANNNRSVYDPTIESIDNAPFEVRLPLSDVLTKFINSSCPDLIEKDPYYSPILDASYVDPQLVDVSSPVADSGYIRSIEDLR